MSDLLRHIGTIATVLRARAPTPAAKLSALAALVELAEPLVAQQRANLQRRLDVAATAAAERARCRAELSRLAPGTRLGTAASIIARRLKLPLGRVRKHLIDVEKKETAYAIQNNCDSLRSADTGEVIT